MTDNFQADDRHTRLEGVERLRAASDELARKVDQYVDSSADPDCNPVLREALHHGRHVCWLALELFDGLAELHRLDESWRLRLAMASLLHDIGQVAGREGHHVNTQEFLTGACKGDRALQSLVDVVPANERTAVGLLGRYHRDGWPSMENPVFAALPMEVRRGIVLCASFLRMADGLDVCHGQEVSRVGVKVDSVNVCLTLHGRDGVTASLAEHANRGVDKGDLFMDLFARKLTWQLF